MWANPANDIVWYFLESKISEFDDIFVGYYFLWSRHQKFSSLGWEYLKIQMLHMTGFFISVTLKSKVFVCNTETEFLSFFWKLNFCNRLNWKMWVQPVIKSSPKGHPLCKGTQINGPIKCTTKYLAYCHTWIWYPAKFSHFYSSMIAMSHTYVSYVFNEVTHGMLASVTHPFITCLGLLCIGTPQVA